MRDKFKAALIGLAVGDALGATTEFMSKEEVEDEFGHLDEIIGGGWLNLKAGEITDDTQMTLCVANGILQDHKNPIPKIGDEFVKWFDSKPKDVGISTSQAIRNFKGVSKDDWFKAAETAHNVTYRSGGNGTLMRCLPIALAYKDESIIEELSKKQSRMTHYDLVPAEICVIYNKIALRLIEGMDLKSAIELEIKATPYRDVLDHKLNCLPDGYVVNTFNWVLKVLYTTNSFEEVVETLANAGEDSDTTAAIAGGLAGLHYGYEAIPDKYKKKIIKRKEIEDIASKLYDLREGS